MDLSKCYFFILQICLFEVSSFHIHECECGAIQLHCLWSQFVLQKNVCNKSIANCLGVCLCMHLCICPNKLNPRWSFIIQILVLFWCVYVFVCARALYTKQKSNWSIHFISKRMHPATNRSNTKKICQFWEVQVNENRSDVKMLTECIALLKYWVMKLDTSWGKDSKH